MKVNFARRSRLSLVTATCVGALAVGFVGQASPVFGVSSHSPSPAAQRSYLALGDSVTFGYREATNLPTPNYANAASFVSYAEDVGAALGLSVSNPSCPGETSLSFTTPGVQSNGCENSPGGGPGYRTLFPLHVSYSGTQLQYATKYLKSNPHTRLISLMIGANDAFLCQETTADTCASELPSVLAQISSNVTKILSSIRWGSHYKGQIVIVNYYSLNYSNATDNAGSLALNAAMDNAAKPFHVQIADGFGAFQTAAAQAGGDSCAAGLLTMLTGGGCGVHPSVAGQAVLALAVEKVVYK